MSAFDTQRLKLAAAPHCPTAWERASLDAGLGAGLPIGSFFLPFNRSSKCSIRPVEGAMSIDYCAAAGTQWRLEAKLHRCIAFNQLSVGVSG